MITAMGGNIRSCRIEKPSMFPPARYREMPYAVNVPTMSASSDPKLAVTRLLTMESVALIGVETRKLAEPPGVPPKIRLKLSNVGWSGIQ